MVVLITGPVRSGKSTRAITVARAFNKRPTHIVTARVDPADNEMADRIARHRFERGAEATIELWTPGAPDLAMHIAAASAGETLLIDSLGTWVAGLMLPLEASLERDVVAAAQKLTRLAEPLLCALESARAHVVIVSEETGWGLVPNNAQGRLFRDHVGRLNRHIGRIAQRVELVVNGYAIDLKALGMPVEVALNDP